MHIDPLTSYEHRDRSERLDEIEQVVKIGATITLCLCALALSIALLVWVW